MTKKRWSDLTPVQQRLVYVAAAAELLVTAVAYRDLSRRPAGAVHGSRAAWAIGLIVQPFGPLAYLAYGRNRS